MAAPGKYQQFDNEDDLLDTRTSRYSFSDTRLRLDSDPPDCEVKIIANEVKEEPEWDEGDLSAPSTDPTGDDDMDQPEVKVLSNLKAVIDQMDAPPGGDGRFTASTRTEFYRERVRKVTDHLAFRIFTILLTLVDVLVIIIDLAVAPEDERPFSVISLTIVTYFLLEVAARIFAKGWREFFAQWIDAADFVIVTVSFVFTVVFVIIDVSESAAYVRLLVAGRLIRLVRLYKLWSEKTHLKTATRQTVSQNKRRYQDDGFDLDLCYITKRVIAMSFPSTGLMAWYRNPIREVARFLDMKHADHYKIYNLCSERSYDESIFHYYVERVPMADHNVPFFSDMISFAKSARDWMDADPDNIIAVHCKGGKGRTGTIICTWLITDGVFEQAQDSLLYFGDRRTDTTVASKFQGVETPSQSRYVGYYETAKRWSDTRIPRLPAERRVRIKSVEISALKGIGPGNGSDLSFILLCNDERVFDCDFTYDMNCSVKYDEENDHLTAHIMNCPILVNDVKVQFASTHKSVPLGYDKCPFYFWFHTSFLERNRLHLPREELDNPHKSKTWKVFRSEFAVTVNFVAVDDDGMDEVSMS